MALLSLGSQIATPAIVLNQLAQPAVEGLQFLHQLLTPVGAAPSIAHDSTPAPSLPTTPLAAWQQAARTVLEKAGLAANSAVVLHDDGFGGLQVEQPAAERGEIERTLQADPELLAGFQRLVAQHQAQTASSNRLSILLSPPLPRFDAAV